MTGPERAREAARTPPAADCDGIELAARIRDGRTTASEALAEAIERIDRLNPAVRAVCHTNAEEGFRAAEAIDRRLRGLDATRRRELATSLPLLGVPTLLKDLGTAARGLASTMGSRYFGRVEWDADCELVSRMRKAGLVPFGRTTSSELGLAPTTEARAYGAATQNPWRSGFTAGGSSGGAAAAVASGMVPIAHGSDGAGSIRIPASCCGVVGMKTSRGLVPHGPYRAEGWGGLVTEHFVSTTVRDCAAALDATAGSDRGAPYAAPPVTGSFLDLVMAASAAGAATAPLRIAFAVRTRDGIAAHPGVARVVADCAALLSRLGHHVVEVDAPFRAEQVAAATLPLISCGAAHAIALQQHKSGRPPRDDELEPTTFAALDYATRISGADYVAAADRGNAIRREIAAFLDPREAGGFHVLLTPVLALPPAPLGRYPMTRTDYFDFRMGPDGVIHYSPFAPLANLTSMPCICVPFGRSDDGLPIGVQLMAALGEERLLLALAARIEARHPWPRTAPEPAAAARVSLQRDCKEGA